MCSNNPKTPDELQETNLNLYLKSHNQPKE